MPFHHNKPSSAHSIPLKDGSSGAVHVADTRFFTAMNPNSSILATDQDREVTRADTSTSKSSSNTRIMSRTPTPYPIEPTEDGEDGEVGGEGQEEIAVPPQILRKKKGMEELAITRSRRIPRSIDFIEHTALRNFSFPVLPCDSGGSGGGPSRSETATPVPAPAAVQQRAQTVIGTPARFIIDGGGAPTTTAAANRDPRPLGFFMPAATPDDTSSRMLSVRGGRRLVPDGRLDPTDPSIPGFEQARAPPSTPANPFPSPESPFPEPLRLGPRIRYITDLETPVPTEVPAASSSPAGCGNADDIEGGGGGRLSPRLPFVVVYHGDRCIWCLAGVLAACLATFVACAVVTIHLSISGEVIEAGWLAMMCLTPVIASVAMWLAVIRLGKNRLELKRRLERAGGLEEEEGEEGGIIGEANLQAAERGRDDDNSIRSFSNDNEGRHQGSSSRVGAWIEMDRSSSSRRQAQSTVEQQGKSTSGTSSANSANSRAESPIHWRGSSSTAVVGSSGAAAAQPATSSSQCRRIAIIRRPAGGVTTTPQQDRHASAAQQGHAAVSPPSASRGLLDQTPGTTVTTTTTASDATPTSVTTGRRGDGGGKGCAGREDADNTLHGSTCGSILTQLVAGVTEPYSPLEGASVFAAGSRRPSPQGRAGRNSGGDNVDAAARSGRRGDKVTSLEIFNGALRGL